MQLAFAHVFFSIRAIIFYGQKGGGINVSFYGGELWGSILSFCGSADDCSVKQRSRTCPGLLMSLPESVFN